MAKTKNLSIEHLARTNEPEAKQQNIFGYISDSAMCPENVHYPIFAHVSIK
jgi:hypothetical protein